MNPRFVMTAALTLATVCWTMAGSAAEEAPGFKPGPEHELLKQDVGVWDADMQVHLAPGKSIESKGVETNRLCCGGLWLQSEFVAEDEYQNKFEGRATLGYDPAKQKYVGTWIDSMAPAVGVQEGSFDEESQTLTMVGKSPDKEGKLVEWTYTTQRSGEDTREFHAMRPGPDGTLVTMMTIQYRKRGTGPTVAAPAKVQSAKTVVDPKKAGWPTGTGSVTLVTKGAGSQKVMTGHRVLVLRTDGRSLVGKVSAVDKTGIVLDGKILVASEDVSRVQRIK